MKTLLPVALMLVSCTSLPGQSPSEPPRPGMAGHPDCRVYFGVMWLDGVPAGQTQQATHYGLNQQQSDWWAREGYKKTKNLCYVPQMQDMPWNPQANCASCDPEWAKHFRWIVFEHTDEKVKRTGGGSRIVAGPSGGRPNGVLNVSDPTTRTEREVEVVSTGAAVYPGGDPIHPPSEQDHQLFFRSEEKDKSDKDSKEQVAQNDRVAFHATVEFIAKNTKR